MGKIMPAIVYVLLFGAGSYCPDQPVTRGQMAVFLATALGLHWPS